MCTIFGEMTVKPGAFPIAFLTHHILSDNCPRHDCPRVQALVRCGLHVTKIKIHLSHPQGKHSNNRVNHNEISSISAYLHIPGWWMQSSSLFYLCKSIASMVSKSISTTLALVTPKLIFVPSSFVYT